MTKCYANRTTGERAIAKRMRCSMEERAQRAERDSQWRDAISQGGYLITALLIVLMSMLLASLVTYTLRQYWPTARPAQLGWGMQWIKHSARASFPSMHATIGFALAQGVTLAIGLNALFRYGRLVSIAVWACAAAIAWSRICLGVHSPSDVMAGVLVGVTSATLVALVVRHYANQWAITGPGRFSSYWYRLAHPSARHK